jgi:hypothetical protein
LAWTIVAICMWTIGLHVAIGRNRQNNSVPQ